MLSPLALSDSELDIIMDAAGPLSPADRQSFLEHVASVLTAQPMLGDGVVSRVCREIFKQHWKAPELERNYDGKYA